MKQGTYIISAVLLENIFGCDVEKFQLGCKKSKFVCGDIVFLVERTIKGENVRTCMESNFGTVSFKGREVLKSLKYIHTHPP